MTDRLQKNNRNIALDILRVAATCAVVLLHTISGVKDTTDLSPYPTVYNKLQALLDLVTWSVPVFVMISGYLFLNPGRRFTWKQILMKYCRRIVLALVLFGVLFACMELISMERMFNASMLGRAFIMVLQGKSWSHMWYLYMVLFLYLATPAIKWLLSRVPRIVVYIVLIVLFLGSSIFPYINKLYEAELLPVLADDLIYVFYYLCGYLFVRECASEKEKVKIPGWVILTSIGLLVASMVTGRILNIMQLRMAYDYPFTVVLSILIFAGAMKYEQSMRNNKELTLSETAKARWMGVSDLCFAIYLIHPLYINIFYKFLHIVPWNYPLQLSFPIFWILFSALALGTAWGLRRIPVLRKYVL